MEMKELQEALAKLRATQPANQYRLARLVDLELLLVLQGLERRVQLLEEGAR
jgi:hypothetical protein